VHARAERGFMCCHVRKVTPGPCPRIFVG
jgi:hypothetical protein